jgi:hypothetical protein
MRSGSNRRQKMINLRLGIGLAVTGNFGAGFKCGRYNQLWTQLYQPNLLGKEPGNRNRKIGLV